MNTKVLVFAVMIALIASMMVISSQQASALQVRTVFDNRHTSASFGDSKICGDHICAKGEKTKWIHAIWSLQRPNTGPIPVAQHGEDIMSKLAMTNGTNTNQTSSK
ncbi:MAG TPA: hypothetical protein VFJ23_00595 [Candidatus Nitrosotalea sp.]|nr:hypothetical protein [Candidatus Nitrosotalea sp.]